MIKQKYQPPSLENNTLDKLSRKLIDVTNQLNEANKYLLRAEQERSQMLANISHDLRAPITAIRSAIDLANSNDALPLEDIRMLIRLIDRRTAALENLIQDMYFLFSIEDRSIPLHLEKVSAMPFFEEYFYSTIQNRLYNSRKMELDIPADLSIEIEIDIQKVIRALDNLFLNAVKYSEDSDRITLSLQHDKSGRNLIILVSDTGIGIPAEHLPYIFDRTYTVSVSRTPDTSTGSGLGLSIVRIIVELHKGAVTCTSKEGNGSTFIITLPEATSEI